MKKLLLCFLTVSFFSSNIISQTTLGAGDIAIFWNQADTPDNFAFVTFVDLEANTAIFFTDCGTVNGGSFNTPCTEGAQKYVVPSGGLKAGDVIQFNGNSDFSSYTDTVITGSMSLATTGDQIIAFQDSTNPAGGTSAASTPTFIFVIHNASTQFLGNPTDSNETGLPNGLSDTGSPRTALGVGAGSGVDIEYDNTVYTGGYIFASVEDAKIALTNPANYYGSDTNPPGSDTTYDGHVNNIPTKVTLQAIWTGNTNNDWSVASNWNTNSVPTSTSNIIIPSSLTNYPTASSAVTFNTLTINSGASFIPQSTVTGTVTYKRNLPTTNWYLVSPPVSGETTEDIIANHTLASGSGGNLGFAPYSNITGPAWLYVQSSNTGALINGIGYSIKLATPGELSFTGTANTSNVSKAISTGSRTNFNLLGNPYTSYINSASFTSANTAILASETIWLWDGTQYITKNAVDDIEIAPGQGFFVEASTNNNVIFSFANQSHQGSDTFMKQKPIPSVELFVDNSQIKRSTKVFYLSGKTTGYDNGYDSKMFGEDNSKLAVFSELLSDNQGKHLAIQTLPDNDYENMVIPIGIKAKMGEKVIFSVNSKNLPSNLSIFIEDKENQIFTNLSKENYSVTPTSDLNSVGRFYIHTSAKNLSIKLPIATSINDVKLYKPEGRNYIIVTGLQGRNIKLKMFDLSGKQVLNRTFNSEGYTEIKAPKLTSGVYLVELVSDLGKTNTKVILD